MDGDEVRAIARAELAPVADESVGAQLKVLASSGILGSLFPADGSATAERLCLVREAVAREACVAETVLAVQALGSYPILLAGTAEQRERWLPGVARGEVAAAFALTEARGGSDVASLALRADRDGDGFVLRGEKRWISNAPDAGLLTVFARTGDGGHRGITAFVVERGAPGLTAERLNVSSGNSIGALRFEDVPVGGEAVLGDVDDGFRIAMRTLDLFRASVGASAVGIAGAALDLAVSYTSTREAFGRPLREFQGVSHPLADAATRLEAARLLVYDAAARYDRGEPRTGWRSSMAKLFATEVASFAVDVAIQAHGAVGVEVGHPLERLQRFAREARIYEGASEIQREIIARELYHAAEVGS